MKKLPLLLAAALFATSATAGDPKRETVHVVEEGETLGGIANRAGVEPSVIIAANGLVEPYAVEKGQKLAIPRQRLHTVKAGESASTIAEKYGVPMTNIAIANSLPASFKVRTGQKLIIPAVIDIQIKPQKQRDVPYFRRPHDGKIIAGYAMRNDGKGHDGIDFAAKPGDMVRASASGTVIYAGIHRARFGNLVVIEHGNGWRTAYGHLSRITVKQGEWVKMGERVGVAGRSGPEAGKKPEVHFEIRKNNKRIDPKPKIADL